MSQRRDMTQPVVTIVGHTCIDNNTVDGIKFEKWGSSAMYIAKYYLRHFGLKSNIISAYGTDFTKYTNDFVFTEAPGNHKTLLYENIINNGHRVQYCRNSDHSTPVALNDEAIELLHKTDILIVAPQISNYNVSYVNELMQYLSKDCLRVLLPQGYMRRVNEQDKIEKKEFLEAQHILSHFDAIVASDEDYDDILDLAEGWATHRPNSSVVITQAQKGATIFHKGESKHIPTTPLPFDIIRSPVGCGDTFSAQFAISLHDKLHPHDAVRHANETTAQALLSEPLR